MKMTFRIILVGGLIVFFGVVGMVVFMPAMMKSPPTTIAHQYTGIEAEGRRVYYTNGCFYCHTQYVRAQDTGMGQQSVRGNYIYDIPLLFGSERTGPDLSYIGRKRSGAWLIEHFRSPRSLSPLSIMPSYGFLSDDELEALSAYLFALGDNVAQERMILPPPPYQEAEDPQPVPALRPPQPTKPDGWSTWRAAGLQRGKELYASRCLSCHGCAGNGLGSYAGTMSVTPADFTQEPYKSMPPEQWFWHVSEGVPGTLMPTWKASLSDTQQWDIVRYVMTIFASPVSRDPEVGDPVGHYAGLTNPVDQTYESLEDAKVVYTRECMICHGVAGRGRGVYASRLNPPPPDFGGGSYGQLGRPTLTDADFFWHISEGMPWTAMPPWKVHYSNEDRWDMVHYIQTFFTQTEVMPSGDVPDMRFPDTYKSQQMPSDASYDKGRLSYAINCAACHGLAGDGKGWRGGYLVPRPADFRIMAIFGMSAGADAEYLAKVTFGIPGTAMPVWGEFLPESERWDLVHFLFESFMHGRPAPKSVYGDGAVSAEFATLSESRWTDQGQTVSLQHGKDVYGTYCLTCHGGEGGGSGPGTSSNASGSPAPFPQNMPGNYIFWRTSEGVSGTLMYPFRSLLSETDMWDIASYVQQLHPRAPSSGSGGS